MLTPFIYESRNCKGIIFRHRVLAEPENGAMFRQSMYRHWHEFHVIEKPVYQ